MNECAKCRDWGKWEKHSDHFPDPDRKAKMLAFDKNLTWALLDPGMKAALRSEVLREYA